LRDELLELLLTLRDELDELPAEAELELLLDTTLVLLLLPDCVRAGALLTLPEFTVELFLVAVR
jgi:hypothetical protein